MNDSGHCNFSDGDMMMDMKMARKRYFHFDVCQRLILKSWEIFDVGDLFGAVCALFILAILYEGLKTLRNFLLYCNESRELNAKDNNEDGEEIIGINDTHHLIKKEKSQKTTKKAISISLALHILQSFLHVLQIGYAYLLMFAAMTFNGWLFLSVCLGSGTGYLFFTKIKWFKMIKSPD